ncbi:MAG: hypothetical protein ACKOEE_15085 [Tagaea sp.]|nr:hypothetical protein [Magnetospirillum sp.]
MTRSDEPPSLDELAKRYLDLWQDQITALAADPETARLMGRSLQLWAGAGPAGWQGIWQAAADGLKGQQGNVFDHGAFAQFFKQPAGQAGGAAAAGPASGNGGGDVAELRRRLAELETRVAGLAPEPGGPRKSPRKRARKIPPGGVS